jgi:DNA-binding response OmpR family regulator
MANCCADPLSAILRAMAPRRARTLTPEPLRVLLVEDNAEAADLVRVYLTGDQDEAFQVDWVSNLLDGMFRLQRPGIDAVLLDLGMPELDGYQSFHAIDVMVRDTVPVVILTADDRPASRDRTLEFGAADYLLKQHSSPPKLKQSLRNAVLRFRETQKRDGSRYEA